MHNIFVQIAVFAVVMIIAGIKSLDLRPEQLLQHAETQKHGDKPDEPERQVTALLHLQQVMQSNLLIVNVLLLLLLATADYSVFQIIAFAFLWLVAVHLLAATKRVQRRAQRFAKNHLSGLLSLSAGLEPALKLLDDSRFLMTKRQTKFYTRGELLEAINASKGVLSKEEKRQFITILAEPAPTQSTRKDQSEPQI